jgi:hypothetical protein
MKAHDFYPGFKLEEESFSKAIIKDVDQNKSRSKKSDLDQEPMTWPREKTGKETGYERFIEEVINPKTGEFYPEKDGDVRSIKNTGATQYITDIYRIRRATGEEFLYTMGIVYAYNSLGGPITHAISKPEIWTKTNFSHRTEYNDKTKQMEKVLQGPTGAEEVYTMPFNKENLKKLYDIRKDENLNFVVKDELTGKPLQVKDVNSQKTWSYFRNRWNICTTQSRFHKKSKLS